MTAHNDMMIHGDDEHNSHCTYQREREDTKQSTANPSSVWIILHTHCYIVIQNIEFIVDQKWLEIKDMLNIRKCVQRKTICVYVCVQRKTMCFYLPMIGSIMAVVAVLLMNIESFHATNMDPNNNLDTNRGIH